MQRAILEQQKLKAEEKEKMMSMILISVIAAILISITIFGMIKLVRYFSPSSRRSVGDEMKKYNEVNTETQNVNPNMSGMS